MQLAHLNAFIGHGEFDITLPVSWAQRSDPWLSEAGVAQPEDESSSRRPL